MPGTRNVEAQRKNIFDTTESCDVLESTRQKIEVDGGLEYV